MPTTAELLNEAQEVLFEEGVLMHLYVGKWTANKKLRQRDILVENVDPSVIYLGHKKLLPREAQQRLTNIEGQARAYVDSHSLDFPIGKARYVYYRILPTIIRRLREFKSQWDVAVDGLIEGYPEFQRQQLEKLDAQAHALSESELQKVDVRLRNDRAMALNLWEEEQRRINRELYPNVDTLRSRYAFEWRLFRVSALEGVDQMNQLDQETLIEAQNALRADFRQWVRQASAQIHRDLGEAAANAHRMLEENNRLSARSLRPLFEAFDAFQSVTFSAGSEFQNAIERIRQRYLTNDPSGGADFQRTAEAVNGSPDELRQLLQGISRLAVDQIADEAGIRAVQAGSFARLLEV